MTVNHHRLNSIIFMTRWLAIAKEWIAQLPKSILMTSFICNSVFVCFFRLVVDYYYAWLRIYESCGDIAQSLNWMPSIAERKNVHHNGTKRDGTDDYFISIMHIIMCILTFCSSFIFFLPIHKWIYECRRVERNCYLRDLLILSWSKLCKT